MVKHDEENKVSSNSRPMLVLCLGDLHIPNRATGFPEAFRRSLSPGKLHHVICTGNVTNQDTYDYLRSLASNNLIAVKGEFDTIETLEDIAVENIGGLRIGVTHGHEVVPRGDTYSLASLARQLDVDILVVGDSPEFSITECHGRYILCPGSATGAFMPPHLHTQPSFALLDIQIDRFGVYRYRLASDGTMEPVDRTSFVLRPQTQVTEVDPEDGEREIAVEPQAGEEEVEDIEESFVDEDRL